MAGAAHMATQWPETSAHAGTAAGDILSAPIARFSRQEGEDWLRAQAALDWPAAGLPPFAHWDPALVAMARMIGLSATPMALLLGQDCVVLMNSAAQALLPPESGVVNGRPVLEASEDIAQFCAEVLPQVLSCHALSFEEQAIRFRQSGASVTRWFDLNFSPVTDADGRHVGALCTGKDMTASRRRRRQIEASQESLRLALEGSGMVGLWNLDVRTGLSKADPPVAEVYGTPEGGEAGIDNDWFIGAVYHEDRDRLVEALDHGVRTKSAFRCRHRILDDEGSVRWVVASATPMLDDDGDVRSMLGVVVEVTEQVETQSALAESRFRFQTLTETLPQIVWSCDADGRHDYFSARWSEFTGVQPDKITPDTWKTLVYPEHADMVAGVWAKALHTGEPYDLNYRFRHHSGEYRWLRVMALPVRDANGQIARWFGTSTDVHDAYLFAEERERLASDMERMARIDQLTGVLTRRAFFERAQLALDMAGNDGSACGLLMLDVDHFKIINDSFGHPVGDRVLASVAGRILSAVRMEDLVGRLGGEEFAIFLPQCSQEQTMAVAERVRHAIEDTPVAIEDGTLVPTTISVGAIWTDDGAAALNDLLSVADRALYQAKTEGRNCTRLGRIGPAA